MNEVAFQYKMGKLIIWSNIIIFVIVGLGGIRGFADEDELMSVIKLLAPINSIYMAAVIKFMIGNKNAVSSEKIKGASTLNKGYIGLTKTIIYLHLIIVAGLILLKIAGFISSISTLTAGLAIAETFFGVYVGTIIVDLFKARDKKTGDSDSDSDSDKKKVSEESEETKSTSEESTNKKESKTSLED